MINRQAVLLFVLFLSLAGCSTPSKTVRLESGVVEKINLNVGCRGPGPYWTGAHLGVIGSQIGSGSAAHIAGAAGGVVIGSIIGLVGDNHNAKTVNRTATILMGSGTRANMAVPSKMTLAPGQRVWILMNEKGMPVKIVRGETLSGETRQAGMREIARPKQEEVVKMKISKRRVMGYRLAEGRIVFEFDPVLFELTSHGKTGDLNSLSDIPIKTVSLAGSFNGWSATADPLEKSKDGKTWSTTRSLADFAHKKKWEFKFVINKIYWVEPPPTASNRVPVDSGTINTNFTLKIK